MSWHLSQRLWGGPCIARSWFFFLICAWTQLHHILLFYSIYAAFHIRNVTNVTSVSYHVLIVTLCHKFHPGVFSMSWVPPFIARFGIKMARLKCSVYFDINKGKLYRPSSDGIPATEASLRNKKNCVCPRETKGWESVCGFIWSRTSGTSAFSI